MWGWGETIYVKHLQEGLALSIYRMFPSSQKERSPHFSTFQRGFQNEWLKHLPAKRILQAPLGNIRGLEVRNSKYLSHSYIQNQTNNSQSGFLNLQWVVKIIMKAFNYFISLCNFGKISNIQKSYKNLLCTCCQDSPMVYIFPHMLCHSIVFESKLKIQYPFAPIYFINIF